MDPYRGLPRSLRPPAHGDVVRFAWRVSIGSNTRLGTLADLFQDLDSAVLLGERWGEQICRAAAFDGLMYRLAQEGPRAIEREVRRFGYHPSDPMVMDDTILTGRPLRRWASAFYYGESYDLVRALADARTPELLGVSTAVHAASYRNPVEVVLTGSGFLIAGVIYVARLVRDWSSTRRAGVADARSAEARARSEEARADLLQWLVDEAKSGRMAVPAGDLLQVATPTDVRALDRLASEEISLELPHRLDPASAESDTE